MALPGIRSGHKPAPFVKPGIVLSETLHGSQKRWVRASPFALSEGDMIRGEGLVEEIEQQVLRQGDIEYGIGRVRFTMKNGKMVYVPSDETVIAFTEGPGEPVG